MTTFNRLTRPEPLFFAIWTLELLRLFWSPPALATIAGVLMIAYVAMAAPRLRRSNMLLCLPLALAAIILAATYGNWRGIFRGFENGSVFIAFFGSIVFLRALADHRPEIARARALFAGLRDDERNGGFLVGAHLIGSILVVGVMAILAPILDRDADERVRRRAAEVSQRGMCLAPLWSPFWVAAAFAAQQIPGIPAWEIMVLGFFLAAVGLVTAHLMFSRGVGLASLWQAVRGFAPIVPAVAVCAVFIAALSSLAGLSTLKALIATVPVLGLAALAGGRFRHVRETAGTTGQGSRRVMDEVVVVTSALLLGRVLELTIGDLGLARSVAALELPPWSVIACVIGVITVASLFGIHQLVSIIVVLVIFMPLDTGVSDLVMMEAALIGWGFASMVGVTAVSTATASAMFGVPRSQLIYGPNLLFVAAFGTVSVALLAVINGLFLTG